MQALFKLVSSSLQQCKGAKGQENLLKTAKIKISAKHLLFKLEINCTIFNSLLNSVAWQMFALFHLLNKDCTLMKILFAKQNPTSVDSSALLSLMQVLRAQLILNAKSPIMSYFISLPEVFL